MQKLLRPNIINKTFTLLKPNFCIKWCKWLLSGLNNEHEFLNLYIITAQTSKIGIATIHNANGGDISLLICVSYNNKKATV